MATSTAAARPWRVVWVAVFAVALLATGASGVSPTPAAGGSALPAARPEPDQVVDAAESTAEPTPAPRQRLVIHGAGDVNLDPNYIPALRANGWDHAWSGLDGLFAADDLSVVNLECPVSDRGAIVEKQFNFRCDPAALPAARQAGVEVVNLANNHVGDYGPQAMLDSLVHTGSAGLAPVGVGPNAAAAAEPAIIEVGGWTIAVLGFGGVIPSPDWLAGPNRPGMANGDDIESMTAAVRAADARADLVFVTIHWGAELETEPQSGDVTRAEAMIDAGADGIFGHHAHRLQPIGEYNGRPIAWGLGNFVWPSLSAAGSRTAVAEFVVEPDGSVTGCLLPAEIVSNGHPVLTGPRSCDG